MLLQVCQSGTGKSQSPYKQYPAIFSSKYYGFSFLAGTFGTISTFFEGVLMLLIVIFLAPTRSMWRVGFRHALNWLFCQLILILKEYHDIFNWFVILYITYNFHDNMGQRPLFHLPSMVAANPAHYSTAQFECFSTSTILTKCGRSHQSQDEKAHRSEFASPTTCQISKLIEYLDVRQTKMTRLHIKKIKR